MDKAEMLKEKEHLEEQLRKLNRQIEDYERAECRDKVQKICQLMRELYDGGISKPFTLEDSDQDSIYTDFDELADALDYKFLR